MRQNSYRIRLHKIYDLLFRNYQVNYRLDFIPSCLHLDKMSLKREKPDNSDQNEDGSLRKRQYAQPAKIGTKLPPHLESQVDSFWKAQKDEQEAIHTAGPLKPDFKTLADLPLSRVKRVMKADGDVRMISAEAPVVFARACSMFILDLTLRSWFEATGKDRRTVQKEDVYDAILKADVFDFLVDIVNGVLEQEKEELKQQRKNQALASASAQTSEMAEES